MADAAQSLMAALCRMGRRSRLAWICSALSAITLASAVWPSRPLLVWNASPSSRTGLYLVFPARRYAPGDTVAAWPPSAAGELAAKRRYLPRGVPLVKTVAAASGDRICAAGDRLVINSDAVVVRLRSDAAGRRLPRWSGCRTLDSNRVLLLGLADPGSFDGRYFGPSEVSQILGRARLLWAA
jgi:conjugative transfer signal peptidase TraF